MFYKRRTIDRIRDFIQIIKDVAEPNLFRLGFRRSEVRFEGYRGLDDDFWYCRVQNTLLTLVKIDVLDERIDMTVKIAIVNTDGDLLDAVTRKDSVQIDWSAETVEYLSYKRHLFFGESGYQRRLAGISKKILRDINRIDEKVKEAIVLNGAVTLTPLGKILIPKFKF